MTIVVRTARRAGVDWQKLDRLRRDVDSRRARIRGLSDHRTERIARRSELRVLLVGTGETLWALTEELPNFDRLAPERALVDAPAALLAICGIHPDDVADCLAVGDEIASLTRDLDAALADLDPRVALLDRLQEFAHHG